MTRRSMGAMASMADFVSLRVGTNRGVQVRSRATSGPHPVHTKKEKPGKSGQTKINEKALQFKDSDNTSKVRKRRTTRTLNS
jgi:hypothetical protein